MSGDIVVCGGGHECRCGNESEYEVSTRGDMGKGKRKGVSTRTNINNNINNNINIKMSREIYPVSPTGGFSVA